VAAIALNSMLHSPQLAGDRTEHTVYCMRLVPKHSNGMRPVLMLYRLVDARLTALAEVTECTVQPAVASGVPIFT
jgi:hypothetical protein